jgi:HK97 family phage major capsid protein
MKYADILRDQVAALAAERAALGDETARLFEAPTTEARDLTPEESDRHAAILARGSEIDAEIAAKTAKADQLDAEEAAVARAQALAPQVIRRPEVNAFDARNLNAGQIADAITRSIEERDIDPTYARSILKRHKGEREWAQNLLARGSEVYASAWLKMVTGRSAFMSNEERAAIAVGTNTQGGYLVPTHLDPTIILTNTGSLNAIRAISRVVTLVRENTWNGVTSAGVTASWDAELAEVSDDSPSFGNAQVPTYQAQALVQASLNGIDDIEALASDVLMMLGDARDRLEGAAHCTGTGSAQPTGIFTALDANTNVEVTSTTAATIGVVDLQGILRALGPRFRPNATFVMNPVYADAIKNLGTALSNAYSTDLTQANAPRILSKPVVETDDAPSTQTTTVRDNEVVVGDFSNYLIVDKPGSTTIDFIPHLFNTANNLPDGRSAWYMRFRSGADSVNDLAFRLLQDKTSA